MPQLNLSAFQSSISSALLAGCPSSSLAYGSLTAVLGADGAAPKAPKPDWPKALVPAGAAGDAAGADVELSALPNAPKPP